MRLLEYCMLLANFKSQNDLRRLGYDTYPFSINLPHYHGVGHYA